MIMPADLCQWIRDNISEHKLSEVKKFLSDYDDYFNVKQAGMIEHVYRGIKNSTKVEYTYNEMVSFASWLMYLLSPDKAAPDNEHVETDLLKLVSNDSFLYNFSSQAREARGTIEKKGHYYLYDKATLTFLGSNVMFYYILTSVVSVVEKAVHNEKYKLEGTLDWQEGIALYVLSEIKWKDRASLS